MNVRGDQTYEIQNSKYKQNGNEKKYRLIFSNFLFFLIFQHIPTHIFSFQFLEPTPKNIKHRCHRAQQQNQFFKQTRVNQKYPQKIGKNHTFEYTNFYSFILFLLQMPKP